MLSLLGVVTNVTSATTGNNTITLVSLSDGTYSNCTITVTDSAGNVSNTLTLTTFIVDSTAATLAEVTAVTTPTNDTTPDYTFSSSEAGTITYGGSCSSSTTSATTGNNTITLVSLSEGTYSDCTITVTDNSSNSVTLNISSFVIETTAPTVSSISTTADNQGSVSITDNITVTFSEAMDTTYVTTNTSDTYCSGTIMVSSDNFSTCVKMSSSSPASSNSNKTFTLDPYDNLAVLTTYLTRVTTGVKDTAGNAMSSEYETSSGFTTDNGSSSIIPTVSSVSTTSDNQSLVSIYYDNITLTFSKAMDTFYVTTNTSDSYCTGTIMVSSSSDNFSTGNCVKMSSAPASSNSDKTFTLDPYDNLTRLTTYLTRVTTGVKDTYGNAISSQYETSSGFTTDNGSIIVPNSGLTSGTTYYWKVVASDPKGGSAQSETWSFTVQ